MVTLENMKIVDVLSGLVKAGDVYVKFVYIVHLYVMYNVHTIVLCQLTFHIIPTTLFL